MASTFNESAHGHALLDEIGSIATDLQLVLRVLKRDETFSVKVNGSIDRLSMLLHKLENARDVFNDVEGRYKSYFRDLLKRHRDEVALLKSAKAMPQAVVSASRTLAEDEKEWGTLQAEIIRMERDLGRNGYPTSPHHGYPTTKYYLNYNNYPQY